VVQSGDFLGSIDFAGDDGAAPRTFARISALVDGTPGSSDAPGRLSFRTSPDGGATPAEWLSVHQDGALEHRAQATTIFDANSIAYLRSYTVATLPSPVAGGRIHCSDLGGGGGELESDGTYWRRVRNDGYGSTTSDADYTWTPLSSAPVFRNGAALTADRVCTLATTNVYPGMICRHVRVGTGAFNLSIGGLKNLAQNTWCDVLYNGSAWILIAYGAL
ncbi:MAG: hypothetical protein AB7O04_15830, partial [Hyphomonadaceae bacterium]